MAVSHSGDIYEEKIDKLIHFYRGRLHLKGSEFKILSDIADDAEKMIFFLETKKELLIRKLKQKSLYSDPSKINGFVLYKARYSEIDIG